MTNLFWWFKTQWFSSGKMTKRLATPRLDPKFVSQTYAMPSCQRTDDVLLKGMERANAVRLGQAVVLAPVDDEHWCLPLVYEVDRVKLLDHLLGAGLPRASSPLVVEEEELVSGVTVVLSAERLHRHVQAQICAHLKEVRALTPSWQTRALKLKPNSG